MKAINTKADYSKKNLKRRKYCNEHPFICILIYKQLLKTILFNSVGAGAHDETEGIDMIGI